MQEKIKEILSVFLKVAPDQINASTAIDRSAVSSSILLHRMYAKLAAGGIVLKDYQQLRTFGDLLHQLNGKAGNENNIASAGSVMPLNESVVPVLPGNKKDSSGSIGIDIEMVSAMPVTNDFREDIFYTMNFSTTEISYCILQTNPYASFAGLFAAKEAIVKADNRFKTIEFKNIPVQHLSNGKPFHEGFNISVAHTGEIAVAVAVSILQNNNVLKEPIIPEKSLKSIPAAVWLLILTSLLLSVIAVFLIAGKNR